MSSATTNEYLWIVVAYGFALIAAVGTVYGVGIYYPETGPLMQAFWADVAATLVIFAFSRIFANSSFYDAYWSVAPPVLIAFWVWQAGVFDVRLAALAVLVMFWAVRLTHNWARGWHGLSHEDWRYAGLKEKTGAFYPLVDLLGIHLFPTLLVFAGCVPLWLAASPSAAPFAAADVAWVIIGFAAVLLELRADNVLRRHRASGKGGVLAVDVWSWSRHPNYLGELGFWMALGLAGYIASGSWWAYAGFALMLALFIFISIPMIERRQEAKAGYAEYQAKVPVLVPGLKL